MQETHSASKELLLKDDCERSNLYRFQGSGHKSCGGLAQLGERLPCKQEVSGSIPLISTKQRSEADMGQ